MDRGLDASLLTNAPPIRDRGVAYAFRFPLSIFSWAYLRNKPS